MTDSALIAEERSALGENPADSWPHRSGNAQEPGFNWHARCRPYRGFSSGVWQPISHGLRRGLIAAVPPGLLGIASLNR